MCSGSFFFADGCVVQVVVTMFALAVAIIIEIDERPE